MFQSHRRTDRSVKARLHRISWKLAALVAVFAVIGGMSLAAAATGGAGAGKFAATFEARAGLPLIAPCPALGPDGQKIEGRYRGTMTIDGEEYEFNFTLEAVFDRSSGLGSAEGRWQLADPPGEADPPSENIVARGEVIGVVRGLDPAHLELIGLLKGQADPPDPDTPAENLLGTVTVTITDGTHVTGAVGDPEGMPGAGVRLPAVRC